jgi:hypothetical protein
MKDSNYLVFKCPGGSSCTIKRDFYEEYILPIAKMLESYSKFQQDLKVKQLESKEYENYWYKRGL